MLSYEAITHAEDDVVGALQREGGELSYPELVSATRLPYDVVDEILEHLNNENRIQITTVGESEIRLIRLRSRSFGARLASFLGG